MTNRLYADNKVIVEIKDAETEDEIIENNKAILSKIVEEIEKLNPVDYGSIYSYESHRGAGEMQRDILDIIDKYIK
jgi:DNA-directed RNA polymerase subunit F